MFLSYLWIFILMFFIATCCSRIDGFWFFSCPHGNGHGQAGDVCSAFCQCHPLNTCEAGIQKCAPPGVYGQRCHVTRPCASGFSCQPGVQKCFHVPRLHGEPCVAGYECGSGLSCEPGVQLCFHRPRRYNEPCSAGFSCAPGLSCQPGDQRCFHHPRRENERCSAGYACADGLVCRLCDKPYATCQLSRVPALTDQDYDRPFNKVAFLVTHNSFSNSPNFAVWVRNQLFSVSQQLKDGVRGLMLDIYPGWGAAEVRLCHASCFWGGSTNLLDTLIVIRKFLESNTREVITIIFEDYLKNPTILKRVFDQAGVSPHVLLKDYWGDGIDDWPTLTNMRRLGRLVVFNNNGLHGFPYTELNMWRYVRENRYGSPGQNIKECVDRAQSRWNAGWNDHWSLVLVNWFSTAGNPLQPCLNSFKEIREKLVTCHDKFGLWANFIAVNYYTAGSGGGAFQAVNWLNDMFKRDEPVAKKRKVSIIPFPLTDIVNHWNRANQRHDMEPTIKQSGATDGGGYGRGFHDLSDIISHILKQGRTTWVGRNNTILGTSSIGNTIGLNAAHTVSRAISPSQPQRTRRHGKVGLSHQKNETKKMFPDHEGNDTLSRSQDQFSNRKTQTNHGLKRLPQWWKFSMLRNSFEKGIGHFENSSKLTNRLSPGPGNFEGRNSSSVRANNSTNLKLRSTYYDDTDALDDASRKVNHRGKNRKDRSQRRKIPKVAVRPANRLHKESGLKFASEASTMATSQLSPPTVRISPGTHGHNTIRTRMNPTKKIRNLRKQLARLKAKLSRYIHLAHPGRKKTRKLSEPLSMVKPKEHTATVGKK